VTKEEYSKPSIWLAKALVGLSSVLVWVGSGYAQGPFAVLAVVVLVVLVVMGQPGV